MFSQSFGNYLLEKELLTPGELKHVLQKKNSVQLQLGVLCVNLKYMTANQVEKINKLQAETDKKFGELAVENGYLTEAQLNEILCVQKSEILLLSQVLINEEYFTLFQISTILDNYRVDLGLSKYEFEAVKNNNIEKVVGIFIKLKGLANSKMYNDYFSLFIKSIVRFIDSDVLLEKAELAEEYRYDWLVCQNIEGEVNLFTSFASDENSMAQLGSRFANTNTAEMNELMQSSIGEFINLQNGLFLTKLSEEGVEPDLQAQELKRNGRLVASGSMFKIPFNLPFGRYDFIISDKLPLIYSE